MSILRKEERAGKERKTKRTPSPRLLGRTRAIVHASPREKRIRLIIPFPLSLPLPPYYRIATPRMWKRGDSTREEKGNKTRVSLSPPPSYLSDVLTGGIKRSHETGKPQSANTPWGRHEYRRIGNRLALGIRRQLAATGLPVFFRYLSPRLESNGNPRQTSCEESGINLLPPSSYFPLSISSLHRGTTTLRSAIFAFLDLVVIVPIGSDKESGFLFARRRGRRSTSSAVPAG